MEYLTLLSQNSTFLLSLQPVSLSTLQPPPLPTPSIVPPPPSQGCSFSCPNRGMGGALVEKQKISKEITASATKHKSPLDPEVELIPELTESHTRQMKHPRPTKVRLNLSSELLLIPTHPRLRVAVSRSRLRSLYTRRPLQTPLNRFQVRYVLSFSTMHMSINTMYLDLSKHSPNYSASHVTVGKIYQNSTT